ncbi:CheR family methyltransferase [Stutzerimonas azotifigens]|uniref:CheR family methyltransferase n=1 Tax=Stutzerimonas azotifigens TaxID=291995 RepID=UPI001377A8C2|nr:CheR family methyltransferase [Stutzerimonas azotifigens]
MDDIDRWLEDLAFADWTSGHIQALVPAFSVGETYFRRDAEAFDWLARHHIGPLLARRRREGQRYLRLWSAACCTGEEAYGLLFMIDELLGAERDHWAVELIATDINDIFLRHARQGLYGSRAFRGNDEAFRLRYFKGEGSRWRVRPTWLGRIRFTRFNLADGDQPSPMQGADLILCRNVLMYFSPARASIALKRLLASLDREGLLLLSSVEAGIATHAGLRGRLAGSNYALTHQSMVDAQVPVIDPFGGGRPVPLPGPAIPEAKPAAASVPVSWSRTAIAPRRATHAAAADIGPAALWAQAQRALHGGRADAAREALQAYLAGAGLSPAQQHQACLLMARSLADEQQVQPAWEWLCKALSLDTSASAYWLQALLEQQGGNSPAALRALQKAFYLEPDFILGYFLQARLLRAEGQVQASAKSLRVCRELLAGQAADSPVPHADGMSCAQLLRLCEQLQQESLA